MPERMLASTRKGLFAIERDGAGAWRLAGHHFAGDNVTFCLHDPRDGAWYAALDLGHFGVKLQVTRDEGRTWTELAVPAYGEGDEIVTGDGKDPRPATLKLLWTLVAGAASQPGRLWAGTIPGGVFRSDDHGASWQLQRGLWDRPERKDMFGGGYDFPGVHSLCVDPRDPRCVRIGISTGGVWRSDDDGATWTLTADGMRAAYMPPERARDPLVQDVHRLVQCAAAPDALWVQHHNGVFRSVDGGATWSELANVPPSVFGFAVAVHPRGLPVEPAFDLVYRHGLAIDATGERLAFASTTGGLWTTDDGGESWTMLPARLPPVLAVTFA